jgi:sec-independent protein translocase protein TatA
LTVPNIGPTELIIVLVIVLLIFGPKRLPGLGKQLGSGMREFKDSITGRGGKDDDDDETDTRVRANAALGRPEDEPAAAPTVDADVASDRPR